MVLCATSEKGGSGKSTLVTNLAAYWANQGERVVVFDLDPQRSSKVWGLLRNERIEEQKQNGHENLPWIDVIGLDDLESKGAQRAALDMPMIVKRALQRWDRVILDTPSADNRLQRGALLVCDVALMPVKPAGFDLLAAPNTFGTIEELKFERESMGEEVKFMLVINFARPRSITVRENAEIYSSHLGDEEVLSGHLHMLGDYPDAAELGLGVIEYNSEGRAAREISILARHLGPRNEFTSRSNSGRPPRKEKTKRVDVYIRLSDARAIEQLGLNWAKDTDSLRNMKVTPIMRSLAAIMVPVLEGLPESPVDEEHLRELLRAAVVSE